MADATKEDLDKSVQEAIDKLFASPNWRARVTETVRDSFKSRESSRKLKDQVTDLQKQLDDAKPKDGSVVLSKEDAAIWMAFGKLGKKPEELTKVLSDYATLSAEATARKEAEGFADAAEALGFKNVPALTRMLTRENLVLEFKDVRSKDENDKTIVTRTPFVKPKGDDKAELESLDEYLEREVPEFLPIFESDPVAGAEEEGETEERPTRRTTLDRTPAIGGVRIAATKGARETTPVTRDKKKLEEEEANQRAGGHYAM